MTPRRVTAGGASLDYVWHGPGPDAAPTLVFLHEGLGSVALWRGFPTSLADATGCGALVYSRAGYGQSDPAARPWPRDYMERHATEVLPEVLEALGVQTHVLIGHSDGASIAAFHAGLVPRTGLRAVVLIAPHFFPEARGLDAIRAAREAYETGDLAGRLALYHADADGAFFGWNDAWLSEAFADWDITRCLDTLRVPVLAIQAEEDPYGTLAQIDVVAARAGGPVTRLIRPGAAHAPHLAEHDLLIEEIQSFVKIAL